MLLFYVAVFFWKIYCVFIRNVFLLMLHNKRFHTEYDGVILCFSLPMEILTDLIQIKWKWNDWLFDVNEQLKKMVFIKWCVWKMTEIINWATKINKKLNKTNNMTTFCYGSFIILICSAIWLCWFNDWLWIWSICKLPHRCDPTTAFIKR